MQSHVIVLIAIVEIAKGNRFGLCTNRFFHQSELKISGELKYFETLGSSGRPIKELFARLVVLNGLPELVPEMISIRAGTLDDPSLYHPKAEVL